MQSLQTKCSPKNAVSLVMPHLLHILNVLSLVKSNPLCLSLAALSASAFIFASRWRRLYSSDWRYSRSAFSSLRRFSLSDGPGLGLLLGREPPNPVHSPCLGPS